MLIYRDFIFNIYTFLHQIWYSYIWQVSRYKNKVFNNSSQWL